MKLPHDRREVLSTTGKAATLGLLMTSMNPLSANNKPYLSVAQQFLDTLIDKGVDRYGKNASPGFCLSLDPETHAPPKPPAKIDWNYARSFEFLYRDFGYYWKSHLHGSGLIYAQGTIRALYALSAAVGNAKCGEAADAYLDIFVD